MPSKSQIALALINSVMSVGRCKGKGLDKGDLRVRVDLVKEASTVVLVEYPRKAPGLLLKWLYILDLYDQNISRFGPFYLKGARQVVNFGEIDVLHVVRAVIVANLSSCPIDTLHLEDLPVFDFGRKRNCRRRGQWQLGRTVERSSCRLDAICSEEGQRMLGEWLER